MESLEYSEQLNYPAARSRKNILFSFFPEKKLNYFFLSKQNNISDPKIYQKKIC